MQGYRGRGAADAAVHGCNELAAVGCNMSARSSVWFSTGVMASLCASVMLLMQHSRMSIWLPCGLLCFAGPNPATVAHHWQHGSAATARRVVVGDWVQSWLTMMCLIYGTV
jgi:hypothetical protein